MAGGRADGPCFAPTVLSGVTPAMRVYQEESFGPIASVVIVDGAEETLRVANDNDYGLSSAIFSRNVTLALDLAKRLNAGMSHINGTTLDDEAQVPFGGVKDSGYGRSGGLVGIEEYRGPMDYDRRTGASALSNNRAAGSCRVGRNAGGRPILATAWMPSAISIFSGGTLLNRKMISAWLNASEPASASGPNCV